MQRLSIGKLARAANVSVDTIRYYEKSGLLPPPVRRPSGFREYSDVDLLQLQFVRLARAAGFSLEEVGQLLALPDASGTDGVRTAIASGLLLLDRKIAQLQQWRSELQALHSPSPQVLPRRRPLLPVCSDYSATRRRATDIDTSSSGIRRDEV